jgi:curved DNA-binding protein CbpA
VFARIENLVVDLDAITRGKRFERVWEPLDNEIGAALISIALGRTPTELQSDAPSQATHQRRDTARQFIVTHFFAADSDPFRTLGLTRSATDEQIRRNYRRIIGLVHPDSGRSAFPIDAASRVNAAYALLSDPERRPVYQESTRPSKTANSDSPQKRTVTQTSPKNRHESKPRVWAFKVPQLRFRSGLVGIGGALAGIVVYLLWLFLGNETRLSLVERKPIATEAQLNIAGEFAQAEQANLSDAASEKRSPPEVPRTPSETASTAKPVQPPVAIEAKKLVCEHCKPIDKLIGRSETIKSFSTPSTDGIIAQQSKGYNGIPDNPQDAVLASTRSSYEPRAAASVGVVSRDKQDDANAGAQSAASQRDTIDIAQVNDLVTKFANAFQIGSVTHLRDAFSERMQSRNALLADYERVFRTTKRRTLQFSQLKHQLVEQRRIVSAGFATVATVDHQNETSQSRIYLEIEMSAEPVGPRILRITNYAQP